MTAGECTASRDVVLVLSYESVGDMVRRGFARPPDRLLLTLASDPRVGRFLIAASFRSAPVQWAKQLLGRRDPGLSLDADVRVVQPRRLARRDPTSVKKVERTFSRYDEIVRRAAATQGLRDPAVVCFHPLAAGFAPFEWAHSVTYYARDDWSALPSYAPWRDVCLESYRRIGDRGRRVVAVSETLMDRLRPPGASAVLPNGIDPAEWLEQCRTPSWLAGLPRPRLLYVGTLDDRLDLDALERVARAFPSGSVVLVGPTPSGSPVERLSLPNVHVIASQPRAALVASVRDADLCLLLHRRTALTEAMSPLKLYEYLAAGRPVLATDLAPIRDVHGHVLLAGPDDDVAALARAALERGPLEEEERLRFLDSNSWAGRHQRLLELALA